MMGDKSGLNFLANEESIFEEDYNPNKLEITNAHIPVQDISQVSNHTDLDLDEIYSPHKGPQSQ